MQSFFEQILSSAKIFGKVRKASVKLLLEVNVLYCEDLNFVGLSKDRVSVWNIKAKFVFSE